MKNVFLLVIGYCLVGLMPAHADQANLQWACRDTSKNSKQCQIRNVGTAPGQVCMDVVKVCQDGDHIAQMCSSWLQPGEQELKVIASFNPRIHVFEKCLGVEYRNQVIN